MEMLIAIAYIWKATALHSCSSDDPERVTSCPCSLNLRADQHGQALKVGATS